MKKALGVAALVLASTVVGVPAAHAGGHCVSKSEFKAVHHGMKQRRVHRIFDTRGQRSHLIQIAHRRVEIRRYRPCPAHAAVSVSYRNGRVTSKVFLIL